MLKMARPQKKNHEYSLRQYRCNANIHNVFDTFGMYFWTIRKQCYHRRDNGIEHARNLSDAFAKWRAQSFGHICANTRQHFGCTLVNKHVRRIGIEVTCNDQRSAIRSKIAKFLTVNLEMSARRICSDRQNFVQLFEMSAFALSHIF